MNYDATMATIDSIMDDAAKSAAEVFLTDVRKNLAPFNLQRHRVQFEFSDIVAHAKRVDERPDSRYAYEFIVGASRSPARQAMYLLHETYRNLPRSIRQHLAGKFLEPA